MRSDETRVARRALALACGLLAATALGAQAWGRGTGPRAGGCAVAELHARLGPTDAALGHRFAALSLINRSRRACGETGYVGLRFSDARGKPLPTSVTHEPGYQSRLVVLRPGGRATTVLEWSVFVVRRSDERGSCRTPPRMLEITPPGSSSRLRVRWTGGLVCQHGRVLIRPLA